VELVHYGLLIAGWVVAFMLGKELHSGYAQWRQSRRENRAAED